MASSYSYLNFFMLFSLLSVSLACDHSELPLKSASLGNWLLTEGWMNSTMFDGIPNNDLLDGTIVQLKSTKLQKYLSAEHGGGSIVVANRTKADIWESFRLWRVNETFYNFRVFNKLFVGLENQGQGNGIVAVSKAPSSPETFEIIRKDGDPNRVRLRSPNGLFLQAKSETEVTADYEGSSWDDEDPSVFEMAISGGLQGEYQITNGYGPKAAQFMRNHWKTYITEDDFKFMSENGLTAVRIPVGWWIAHDPNPPKPFVGGSLEALDNAFKWAYKYRMKVIVDLHAPRVSQNGYAHSATRDGIQEWGESDIPETVSVIDFLASRYGTHPSLAAIELMNEPLAPGMTVENLIKYYQAGYDAVRKYTNTAFVILSNRLGGDQKELLSFADKLDRAVIDVHYYNLFSDWYKTLSVDQNIQFVYNQRAANLSAVTTPKGPLSFVGEWSADWEVKNATKRDLQRFAEAQMQVYKHATFGWAYWSYKCDDDSKHWNLRWMIENGYMKL
ncbi:hypothetical protein Dsin_016729 [Dipteronia sinensis]|uniref:Mannan endo-1,4-beta-mannosidase n=1 Tax=Dipteronia sinensis TaxID=43782 RepID=A0AAE0AEL4_9ROSI|nr:hypothetical protein Dsin_016729 [Dipteronia sinensis]